MNRYNRLEVLSFFLLAALVFSFGAFVERPLAAAMTAAEARRLLDEGLDHFYNLEYDRAIANFERLREDDPGSAKWHNHVAMAYFYKELLQGGAFEGDLFDASNKFFKTKKFPVDSFLDSRFHRSNQKAIEICEQALKTQPEDRDALYSCGVGYAARAAHQGLIERSALNFLGNARRANNYHSRLVRAHPRHYDGYLIPGLYDFVLGSLPGPVKFLFFFAGLTGDKQRGMHLVENVSVWGNGAKHDAQILLTVIYRREKRFADARRTLEQLAVAFPRNYIFPLEIASLYRAADELPKAIRAYEQVLEKSHAGTPNFSEASAARIHFELGVLYQRTEDMEAAHRHFEQVAASRGSTPDLNAESAANLERLRAAPSP
ncbi:MAG: tetratricopeptide repeat protein [Acidobacteria bacterium]|nr:tetratricopeptide repeat protein [Acidobacteriota bacterium]